MLPVFRIVILLSFLIGANATTCIKSTCYNKIRTNEQKAEHKTKAEKLFAEGKDVAQKFIEDQVAKAIEWPKDEDNRERVLQYGIMIAPMVLSRGTKLPKKNDRNKSAKDVS